MLLNSKFLRKFITVAETKAKKLLECGQNEIIGNEFLLVYLYQGSVTRR